MQKTYLRCAHCSKETKGTKYCDEVCKNRYHSDLRKQYRAQNQVILKCANPACKVHFKPVNQNHVYHSKYCEKLTRGARPTIPAEEQIFKCAECKYGQQASYAERGYVCQKWQAMSCQPLAKAILFVRK